MAGQVLDARYELRQPVGQGGMGVVWRAYDSLVGRDVAVKEVRFPAIMPVEARQILCARIRQECEQVAALEHPAVVRVLDLVDDEGRPLIVTELVEAPTLALQVSSGGPLRPEQVAAIGIDVLDALATAHAAGVVHRFVQPSKVLLPAGGRARLTDFGLAALIGDPLVSPSGAIDTVSYMAPEQNGRPVGDVAADVWSVAATLFFAVEGRPPYDAGAARATLAAIASDPPRPLLRAGGLRPILEDVLVKDPAARPDVATFRQRLAAVAGRDVQERRVHDVVHVEPGPRPATDGAPPSFVRESLADPAESPFFADRTGPAPEGVQAVAGDGVWSTGVAFGPATAPVPVLEAEEPPPPQAAQEAQGPEAQEQEPSDEPEPPDEPPPPLPPKVALSRMFSPDVERPPPPYEDAVPPDDPPPRTMWPLARPWRPGAAFLAGMIIAVLVFLVITGSRFLTGRSDRVARSDAAAVNWVTYTDQATGFQLEHPANWTVAPSENIVDFRDPVSSAALRVAIQEPPRGSPEQVWLDLERRFVAEHPSYKRLRLEPTTTDGRESAAWEFTWTDRTGTELHNSDLAMNVGGRAYALNFQTRADEWASLGFLFDRFTSSFKPPP